MSALTVSEIHRLTPLRFVVRVTIRFTTSFHVGIGKEAAVADAAIVTDVNGLPAIPGDSIAGVLRSAYREAGGADEKSIFGFQDRELKKGEDTPDGQGSRLKVSWACIHDKDNKPVEGLVSWKGDEVLDNALTPPVRDHVALGHSGTTEGRQKFDETAVCRGHRFTFELELGGAEGDRASWQRLLSLLCHGGLRLGGRTRRGYGAFEVVAIWERVFDFEKEEDFAAYCAHPPELARAGEVLGDRKTSDFPPAGASSRLELTLHLQPEGYWFFGGGSDDQFGADMAPVREAEIRWPGEKGTVAERLILLPGTGLKGALRHRVAFHHRRLSGEFADIRPDKQERSDDEFQKLVKADNPAVTTIFGYARDGDCAESTGQPGVFYCDDLLIDISPKQQQLADHVGIDRFTGGAREGVLFSELPIWRGEPLTWRIVLAKPAAIPAGPMRGALFAALEDLAAGRLALGGGTGRGEGIFSIPAADLEPLREWADAKP